jgi:hypothetical protein
VAVARGHHRKRPDARRAAAHPGPIGRRGACDKGWGKYTPLPGPLPRQGQKGTSMAPHTAQSPLQAFPADRSPLPSLYALESRLHLELVRSGPTPSLLRALAMVESRLNREA